MGAIAVIPARGGSKGVPGKNRLPVGGVPLVARAVRSALAAAAIDRVLVSTDDDLIAAVARAAGAEIVERPAELAGDTASSESALLHVLDAVGAQDGQLVFLQATSPFLDPADLDEAVRQVRDGVADSVFSAVETYEFLWRRGDEGASGVNHDHSFRPRRQDREPHFRETGAFYVMDVAGFRAAGFRFFGRVGMVPVDARGAVEIDDAGELEVARRLAPLLDAARAPDLDVDAVVTDFDGVHTADTATIGVDGLELVTVHRGDGLGVRLLREAGVPVLILSTEEHPVVAARAAKLRVEVLHGQRDKARALRDWADARGIDLARVAYVGNDVNDLGALGIVGWPVAVPDSAPAVLEAARHVLTASGGRGAVRELAELVLAARARRGTASAPHRTIADPRADGADTTEEGTA